MTLSLNFSAEEFPAEPDAALDMLGHAGDAKPTFTRSKSRKWNDLIASVAIEGSAGFQSSNSWRATYLPIVSDRLRGAPALSDPRREPPLKSAKAAKPAPGCSAVSS